MKQRLHGSSQVAHNIECSRRKDWGMLAIPLTEYEHKSSSVIL